MINLTRRRRLAARDRTPDQRPLGRLAWHDDGWLADAMMQGACLHSVCDCRNLRVDPSSGTQASLLEHRQRCTAMCRARRAPHRTVKTTMATRRRNRPPTMRANCRWRTASTTCLAWRVMPGWRRRSSNSPRRQRSCAWVRASPRWWAGPIRALPSPRSNPPVTPMATESGVCSPHSDPIRTPFSATERFISSTTHTSAAMTTASTQNTSK